MPDIRYADVDTGNVRGIPERVVGSDCLHIGLARRRESKTPREKIN
jgi:hypothetical protein